VEYGIKNYTFNNMKITITVVGHGGAFAPISVGNSNFLLTSENGKKMMIDFGATAPYILRDEMDMDLHDIDALYLTHIHSDHCGGLEFLAFYRYFVPPISKPKLFMVDSLFSELWDHTLKGGLESVQGQVVGLRDYFDCSPIRKNKSFVWENCKFTPIQTIHVVSGFLIKYSYGLMIETTKQKTFISGDTQYAPSCLASSYARADLILHDCDSFQYPKGHSIHAVHAHYNDLKNLPVEIRNKMWLYHYSQKIDTYQEDGFAGFATKGQEFEI
jgi:ribonuclease BN (tRNA processing enzyme)